MGSDGSPSGLPLPVTFLENDTRDYYQSRARAVAANVINFSMGQDDGQALPCRAFYLNEPLALPLGCKKIERLR